MTVLAWLQSRTPPAQPALLQRVVGALGNRATQDSANASALCLDAAEQLLAQLLAQPELGRESALDLLAADALVTYALEAAAADSERLEDSTVAAMTRLAGLAAGRTRE